MTLHTHHHLTSLRLEQARRVIRAGQHESGAYIASPNFGQYRFGWLRDGSYVALAMDAVGDGESSGRFHRWVANVVRGHASDVEAVVAAVGAGTAPDPERLLPTRYTLVGTREENPTEAWPNFQLDGYGTWLFALSRHLGDRAPDEFRDAIVLAAEYLRATRDMACFDYWEEYGDRRHTSTLAAVAAGLRAASVLVGDRTYAADADHLLTEIRATCVADGAFVKGPHDDRVDASLISLATPFDLVAADDPAMTATYARVRAELASPSGGIRRYVGDTYYGGNPWILLTAWLGWHARRVGDLEVHEAAREWIERAAHPETGELPEQLTAEPQSGAEAYVAEWTERWGPVAHPLLWSHAKYILMMVGDAA